MRGGPESTPNIPGSLSAVADVEASTGSGRIARRRWVSLWAATRLTTTAADVVTAERVSHRQDMPLLTEAVGVARCTATMCLPAQQGGIPSGAFFAESHIAIAWWAQQGIPHVAIGIAV